MGMTLLILKTEQTERLYENRFLILLFAAIFAFCSLTALADKDPCNNTSRTAGSQS